MFNEKINELIKEEVNLRVSEVKIELSKTKRELSIAKNKISILEEKNKKLNDLNLKVELVDFLAENFSRENVTNFIEIFKLEKSEISIQGSYSDKIPLWGKLLIQYYPDKEKLFQIFDLFQVDYPDWAKDLRLPHDYNEKEVKYVLNNFRNLSIPNGCYTSGNIGYYWEEVMRNKGDIKLERLGSSLLVPLQLFFSNPLLLQDENFKELIKILKKDYLTSKYIFSIQKYQIISKNQVVEISNCLDKNKQRLNEYETYFFQKNTFLFKENPNLARRYIDSINTNKNSGFYFLNFPEQIQKDYVMSISSVDTRIELIKMMETSIEEKKELLHEVVNNINFEIEGGENSPYV